MHKSCYNQKDMSREYTVGLDIGTNSVGWAVIDDDFNLLQGKKKISGDTKVKRKKTNLLGSFLFSEGRTAADRRAKRGIRRRIARRHERLQYLRGIFESEISKIDDSFFIRLDESFYQLDDKNQHETTFRDKDGIKRSVNSAKNDYKYPLFKTETEEKEYYKKFPTIYHLRNYLTENEELDLRKIYLALHHIVKFRGHFVQEENTFDFSNINIQDSVRNLVDLWNEYSNEVLVEDQEAKIEEILKEKISPSFKRKKVENVYNLKPNATFSELIKLAVGNQANLKKPFGLDADLKITSSDEEFEDKISNLTDDQQAIAFAAQKINNDMLLDESLLNGSLSAKMIEKFDAHKEQLARLKEIAKVQGNDFYKKIFASKTKDGKFGVYTKYIQGVGNPAKTYGTAIDEFYKDLRKVFSDAKVDLPEEIAKPMELGEYLPKQRVYTNGVIPYQVHLNEMEQIIAHQRKNFPQIDWDAIPTLMKFRIPYYVGTLANNSGWKSVDGSLIKNEKAFAKNSWLVRNSDDKITPWNFDKVVNKDASAVNFIERMTSFDTYLPSEKVLPSKSLTYQKYAVLNELTKVRVANEFLDAAQKTKVFNDLFAGEHQNGKVTKKLLVNYLNKEFPILGATDDNIFGIDGRGFNAQYTTIHDLQKAGVAWDILRDDKNMAELDNIIKMQTIFDDKKRLLKNLENFSDILTSENISKLSKKHYTGWGRLSRKLLTGVYDRDGHNILWLLENDKAHRNLMQLLTDENLPFIKIIEQANTKNVEKGKISYDLVADLATSPAIKRGIWQTLKIVDELVKFKGYAPKNIAIEFARGNEKGGLRDSRKRTIEKSLKKLQEEFRSEFNKELVEKIKQKSNSDFSQRLQLYFLQNGKDAYDGTDLDIDQLSSYDIDHVVPQSLLKDDSIDNKVLTKKVNNDTKLDRPAGQVFPNMIPFWIRLERSQAISQIKLSRLRKMQFTDDDLRGFINRQLVETRQIMKNVSSILREVYGEDVNVLTPRARFAHDLRIQNDWPKIREINDYHHAHDAYLNAVVGVFRQKAGYDKFASKIWQSKLSHEDLIRQAKFQSSAMDVWNRKKDENGELVKNGLKETSNNKQFWLNYWTDKNTSEIWWGKETIDKIGKVFSYRDVNVVRKTDDQVGKFGDESVFKKDKNAKNFAAGIKNNLRAQKYGGTKAPISAFAVLIRNHKDEIKPLSISSMVSGDYLNAPNKLNFIRNMYPEEGASDIVVKRVNKYTKYITVKCATRLLSSYQEAQVGTQMPLISVANVNSTTQEFNDSFNLVAAFIIKNKLFLGDKVKSIPKIKEWFDQGSPEEKVKLLAEMIRLAHGQNQGLSVLQEAGLGTTAQQLKNRDDLIQSDVILIYQSPTGLHETRKLL